MRYRAPSGRRVERGEKESRKIGAEKVFYVFAYTENRLYIYIYTRAIMQLDAIKRKLLIILRKRIEIDEKKGF